MENIKDRFLRYVAIDTQSNEESESQPSTEKQFNLLRLLCDELKAMLLEKNRKYGDSALNPCRVFSRANAVEQILVRIDDKLSRIRNRQGDDDEDAVMDLAGYLVLLMIKRDELAKDGGK